MSTQLPAKRRITVVVLVAITAFGWWGYDAWSYYLREKRTAEYLTQAEVQRHTKISGQIFIVTQNGDSVKLGDVSVSVVGKNDFNNHLREAANQHKKEMEDADREIAFFSDQGDKTAARIVSATSAADRHINAELLTLQNESLAEFTTQKNQTLETIFDEIVWNVKPLARTRTDADGKFTIQVDKWTNNFYLLATVRREIHGQSKPLIWVIDGIFVSSPLLLSNANLFWEKNLWASPSPAIPEAIVPKASKSPLRWWAEHLLLLCVMLAIAVASFAWLRKERDTGAKQPVSASSFSRPFDWKNWRRSHRLTVALIFCAGTLWTNIPSSTDGLDYQQHPIAVILGCVVTPFLGAACIYWWFGRGKRNSATEPATPNAPAPHAFSSSAISPLAATPESAPRLSPQAPSQAVQQMQYALPQRLLLKADIGARVVASLIDGVIGCALIFGGAIAPIVFSKYLEFPLADTAWYLILFFFVSFLWIFGKDSIWRGQGLGKRLAKIAIVVPHSCLRAGRLRCVWRQFVYCLIFGALSGITSGLGVGKSIAEVLICTFCLLEFILVVSRRDGRRIVDILAGTQVVNVAIIGPSPPSSHES